MTEIGNTIGISFVFTELSGQYNLHEKIRGSGGLAPLIHNFGTRWRLQLYFNTAPYPLNKGLDRTQSQSRRSEEGKKSGFPWRESNHDS